jgi:hypothetical protein
MLAGSSALLDSALKRPSPRGRHALTPSLSHSHCNYTSPSLCAGCFLSQLIFPRYLRHDSLLQSFLPGASRIRKHGIYTSPRALPRKDRKVPDWKAGLRRIANPPTPAPLVRATSSHCAVIYRTTTSCHIAALRHTLPYARLSVLVRLIALTLLGTSTPSPGSWPGRRATHYSRYTTLV